MKHQAVLNRIWCKVILEELARFGVKHVCIAPGSRSTPLTLEAEGNKKLELHTHFDERGLGYFALGLAKASKQPVAIIVTSGTAVANLLPSIAEANLTGEKLVALTADRPVELVGCGANQAINQVGIFAQHVTEAVYLPSPNTEHSLNWLLTTLDDVMFKQTLNDGPVHINCPFPEPLYSQSSQGLFDQYQSQIQSWTDSSQTYCQRVYQPSMYVPLDSNILERKGLIVLGRVTLQEAQQAKQFAEQLGWPLLADPQSGVSSDWAHYDLWLQNRKSGQSLSQCDLVIQLGAQIISKRFNAWLERQVSDGCDYVYVSPKATRNNQSHLPQLHYVADIYEWLLVQSNAVGPHKSTYANWADSVNANAVAIEELVASKIAESAAPSEIALACLLENLPNNIQLFLGNSLFVRLVDMFSKIDEKEVYTNRGASGIDGNVATIAGTQSVTQKPMVAFIGDTTLLYDLNSLPLLSERLPLVLVVLNNDGGAIFNLLPVPEDKKRRLYQMPHGFEFEQSAKQFGLSYNKPKTLSEYQASLRNHIDHGVGAMMIEISVPPNESSTQLSQIVEVIHAG